MRAGAIFLAGLVLAAEAAAAPANLHAQWVYGMLPPGQYRIAVPCAIKLEEGLCVDLFSATFKGDGNQGIHIQNNTGHLVRVDLSGCRLSNGDQTVLVDGPYSDATMTLSRGDVWGAVLWDMATPPLWTKPPETTKEYVAASVKAASLHSIHEIRSDAVFTCRKAVGGRGPY